VTSTSAVPAKAAPTASVIMANHNGAAYLADAVASVREQSLSDLELIICDDASTDESVSVISAARAADPRIHLVRGEQKSGPAAARNKALSLAKGDWIAVMDSDDLMHRDRLETLVAQAERDVADIAADGLVEFDGHAHCARLLNGNWGREPFWVNIRDYLRLNMFYGMGPALGYLKPLFRRSCFEPSIRYDESLRIGEDFDLALRLLHMGKKYRVYPRPLYYYRKHATSTSHRLNEDALIALKAANLQFLERIRDEHPALIQLLQERDRSIETALSYEKLLFALKNREWRTVLDIAIRNPAAAALLRLPIGVRIRRLLDIGQTRATATRERGSHQVFDTDLRKFDREAR